MIRKLINILKLIFSYLLSIILRKPIHAGMPLGISVEPTNVCNLKCIECPTGTNSLSRKIQNIDRKLYEDLVDELRGQLTNIIFYFQGEPFLNKEVFEMISYANMNRIYTISSTNGHFLSRDADSIINCKLDKLIVSLDGIDQETYEKYRVGGEVEKVYEGVQNLVHKKDKLKVKHPKIIIQFIVTSNNEYQLQEAKLLAKQLGANKFDAKSAQIYNFENGNQLIPENKKYSRYRKVGDKYIIKSKLPNRCWRLWSNAVITSNGDVVPCCFDKDAKYAMGNLHNNSFKEIWNSSSYQSFRKKVFTNRRQIDICKNCTSGL